MRLRDQGEITYITLGNTWSTGMRLGPGRDLHLYHSGMTPAVLE